MFKYNNTETHKNHNKGQFSEAHDVNQLKRTYKLKYNRKL